jgi:TolA-binding protein
MNDIMVPKQEIVTRWVIRGALAVGAVVAINAFGPSVNGALTLLHDATETTLKTGLLVVAGFAIYKFLPAFNLLLNSLARKATWRVIEFDPISPLENYQIEIKQEGQKFADQIRQLSGTVSQINTNRDDLMKQSDDAQAQYDAGMRLGKDPSSLRSFATRAGTLRASAQNISTVSARIAPVLDLLRKMYDVYKFQENELDDKIIGKKAEWSAFKAADASMNSARKLLSGSSKQLQFYEDASSLITKEFGSVFGQLNDLQLASQEVIDSIDIQKGVYDMEAFNRWQAKAKPLLIADQTSGSSSGVSIEGAPAAAPVFFQN